LSPYFSYSSSAPNSVANEEKTQNQKKQIPIIKITNPGRIRIERLLLDNHSLPRAKYHQIDMVIISEEASPEITNATPIRHEKYRFSLTYMPFCL